MRRLDFDPPPPRERWALTATTVGLLLATLPIPDGIFRWLVIAAIMIGFFTVIAVRGRRS